MQNHFKSKSFILTFYFTVKSLTLYPPQRLKFHIRPGNKIKEGRARQAKDIRQPYFDKHQVNVLCYHYYDYYPREVEKMGY